MLICFRGNDRLLHGVVTPHQILCPGDVMVLNRFQYLQVVILVCRGAIVERDLALSKPGGCSVKQWKAVGSKSTWWLVGHENG
jgi:hypothetical protein